MTSESLSNPSGPTPFGLVLGGGGARGLAHIGVWKVLEEHGLNPSVIAGTSMGGLVGAFIAAGHSASTLEKASASMSWRKLLDWRIGTGLLKASAFDGWLSSYLPQTFEELTLPFAVTATDVLTGRGVYLSRGPLLPALRATSAYPGMLDPVSMDDMLLADGGILNQVPVDAALFLGVKKVVAVDVTVPHPLELMVRRRLPWRNEANLGAVQALRRAVDIMQAQLTDARLSLYRPDILLTPQLGDIDLQSFTRSAQAIEAGEKAARQELKWLQEVLQRP